jgi:hypothetical protein
MNYHTGVTPSGAINFDKIFFGDGDEWSSMLTDQRYRQLRDGNLCWFSVMIYSYSP